MWKTKKLLETREYAANIAEYIPGILGLVFQRMLEDIDTKEQPGHFSYKDFENLEFQMHISFPMKTKKATEDDTDTDTELITVYNFFAHLIEEFNVTKYGKDRQLIQTFSPYETYQYSDAMLKQLSEKSLKKLRKTLLYSNKPVVYNKNAIDSGTCNSTTPADVTDDNLDKRITLFQN